MASVLDNDGYDAAIIGCGPAGLAAAALLAHRGHRVVVLERHESRYGLPRAGHVDHEVVRILQGLGAHQTIMDDAPELEAYRWLTGDGIELLSFPFGEPSISGYQADFMLFQPVLDDALFASLATARVPADVQFAADVVGTRAISDGVELTVATTVRTVTGARAHAGSRTLSARYVLAADGAGSTTRQQLGITQTDLGFDEAWYTIDCIITGGLPANIDGQWCDPRRPTYIGPLGKRHHRFEMAVMPGEDTGSCDEAKAWQLLAERGVGPSNVDIYRRVVYTFESRVADRWNVDHTYLVGDAAHTMPPHMGQGLCSGIRDAANLAWKLDLVLSGGADPNLLDTYESERKPHARGWIERSVAVGKISCETDPARAATRDAAILSGAGPRIPEPPAPGPGVFLLDERGNLAAPAGALFPQGNVVHGGRRGLFHDVVGHGFLLVCFGSSVDNSLSAVAERVLELLDATVVWCGQVGEPSVEDVDGLYARYAAFHECAAVLVRPDYYVFGAASTYDEIDWLLRTFGNYARLRTEVAIS